MDLCFKTSVLKSARVLAPILAFNKIVVAPLSHLQSFACQGTQDEPRGSYTTSEKQNSLKLEKLVRENNSQLLAVLCEGGVMTLFSLCSNSQRNCYLQSSASYT